MRMYCEEKMYYEGDFLLVRLAVKAVSKFVNSRSGEMDILKNSFYEIYFDSYGDELIELYYEEIREYRKQLILEYGTQVIYELYKDASENGEDYVKLAIRRLKNVDNSENICKYWVREKNVRKKLRQVRWVDIENGIDMMKMDLRSMMIDELDDMGYLVNLIKDDKLNIIIDGAFIEMRMEMELMDDDDLIPEQFINRLIVRSLESYGINEEECK